MLSQPQNRLQLTWIHPERRRTISSFAQFPKPLLASSRTDCSSNWKCLVAAELPSALPKCRHRQGFRSAREAGAPARIVPHRGCWSLGPWFATHASWEVIQGSLTCRNSLRGLLLSREWLEDFSSQD